MAINGERYTGVQCGGMDQSISVMGVANSCLLIDFVPKLQATCTPIPAPSIASEPYLFVVANTMVVADKHTTAPTNYNLRVVETRLASALLAFRLGLQGQPEQLWTLKAVADAYAKTIVNPSILQGDLVGCLDQMLSIVDKVIEKEIYSIEKIATTLSLTVSQLESKFIGSIVIKCNGFDLYKRTKHVYSEAKRVYEFCHVTQGTKPFYTGQMLQVSMHKYI